MRTFKLSIEDGIGVTVSLTAKTLILYDNPKDGKISYSFALDYLKDDLGGIDLGASEGGLFLFHRRYETYHITLPGAYVIGSLIEVSGLLGPNIGDIQ